MPQIEFSPAQKDAIYSRGENLLVSAGAGSGKTTVLVERILRYVESGGNIGEVLALTFTNAAAMDMKEKLDKAISHLAAGDPANRHLQDQLSLLPQAQISTIHSFCLELLRRNYYRIGLNAGFRVAAENDITLLRREVLQQYLEDAYEDNGSGIRELADAYGGNRDDSGLFDIVLALHDFCRSRRDPWQWLKRSCDAFDMDEPDKMPFAKYISGGIKNRISLGLTYWQKALAEGQAVPESWLVTLGSEIEYLRGMLDASELADLLQLLEKASFASLRVPRGDAYADAKEVKALRDMGKKEINALQDKYANVPWDEQCRRIRALAQPMAAFYRLITGFDQAFEREKQKRGWIDFGDMEHYTLDLLADESIRQEIGDTYREILVDEYQDINEVQEAIIQRLAAYGNLFVVGDVKQSIYRFRLAEPQLFLAKYNAYGNKSGGRRIDLNNNYRSEKPVIDGVNFIFRQLMHEDVAELEYDAAAELKTDKTVKTAPPEFWLIDMDKECGLSAKEAEAAFIAKRIAVLHEKGYAYNDMAVLLRSVKSRDAAIIGELMRMGIPVVGEGSLGYLDTPEVQLILSALHIIDNPRQDIPLAAVLRSWLGGFSPDEMADIRLAAKEGCFYEALQQKAETDDELAAKCRAFCRRLQSLRRLAGEGSVADVILCLLRENGYYQLVGAMPGGAMRQGDLQLLLQEAYNYEKQSYAGLFRFIQQLDKIRQQQLRSPCPQNAADAGGVHIMSIHKSKGLEFPVVFVAGLAGQFNFSDERQDIIWEREAGLGPLLADRGRRRKYATLCHTAVADRLHELALAEEMRICYVALTRARERLILCAAARDMDKHISSWLDKKERELSSFYIINARCPLSWLGAAVLRHPSAGQWRRIAEADNNIVISDESSWRVGYIPGSRLDNGSGTLPPLFNPPEVQEPAPELTAVLDYQYPGRQFCGNPAKWTVSALLRLAEAGSDEESALPDYAGSAIVSDSPSAKEGFGTAAAENAAKRGTATHLLLEKADLSADLSLEGLRAQLDGLMEKGLLCADAAALVRLESISSFFGGELGQRFCRSDKKVRELPFTLKDTAGDGTEIVVQGIIDAVFAENDGWVVLDYKTGGRGKSDDELRDFYLPQLAWYKKAVQRLLGAPVKESWLIMLDLDKQIEL